MKTALRFLIAILLPCAAGGAFGSCDNARGLLAKPRPGEVNACLDTLKYDLGRGNPVDTEFVLRFIEVLLPADSAQRKRIENLGPFDRDFVEIAEIISLLESERLIATYIDFIADSGGSADELRSYGLGKLYTLRAPALVRDIEQRNPQQQAIVIASLAWGLANNFYPHIREHNYRRLIVGEHWELLDAENRSDVQLRIESAVRDIVKDL